MSHGGWEQVKGASVKLLYVQPANKAERIYPRPAWIVPWLSLQMLLGPLSKSQELCVIFPGYQPMCYVCLVFKKSVISAAISQLAHGSNTCLLNKSELERSVLGGILVT